MSNRPLTHAKLKTLLGRSLWVLPLLVLSFWLGQLSRTADPDPQFAKAPAAKQIRQVTLTANPQHHFVARGSINSYPVSFFVDTGASDVVLPAGLAAKIGLKGKGYTEASTPNGAVKVSDTRLRHLRIGTIRLSDVDAAINPAMKGEEVLLGMSALHQLEFRHKSGVLTLKQSPR